MKKFFEKVKTSRHPEFISGFHESEIPKQVRNDVSKVRRAFTLAEVLITLMIIGVVAVLVIPAFIANINETTLKGQRETAQTKILEGLRQMRVDGKLNTTYPNTEAFVKEMQNYFKINAVCSYPNWGECFTKNFKAISNNGKTTKNYDINTMVSDSMITSQLQNYYNPVAIVFSDGVTMLLAYKQDCVGPAEGNTTGNVWQCISYAYDVNGSKIPNKVGSDIISTIDFVHDYDLPFEVATLTEYAPATMTDEIIKKYNLIADDTHFRVDWGSSEPPFLSQLAGMAIGCAEMEPKGTWRLPTWQESEELGKAMFNYSVDPDQTVSEFISDSSNLSKLGISQAELQSIMSQMPAEAGNATIREFCSYIAYDILGEEGCPSSINTPSSLYNSLSNDSAGNVSIVTSYFTNYPELTTYKVGGKVESGNEATTDLEAYNVQVLCVK